MDEAVAVLQAHQAKEAAQKSTTPAGVPSVWGACLDSGLIVALRGFVYDGANGL